MSQFVKFILIFLLSFFVFIFYSFYQHTTKHQASDRAYCQPGAKLSLDFFRVNNQGKESKNGANYVILFDPKSPELEFKVSVGLSHSLYQKNSDGEFQRDYIPKYFHEIIADQNAQLKGERPIAAINADYIGTDYKPQGLNISRGVEYSGIFKNKRSSFGISGGKPQERQATIQIGKREDQRLNYNLVGGNGRFYQAGRFKDICEDLGEFACRHETARSMASITAKGYVILLVNNAEKNQELYPEQFDDVLEGIARDHCLGTIQEGMLFDGGLSVALYFNQKIYVQNSNPMGSVFLIYKTPG